MVGGLEYRAHGPEVTRHFGFPSKALALLSSLKSYSVLCLILEAVTSTSLDE